jgi:predicted DCC family thiol-disulfide oxidoreductase YuxK
VLSLNNFVDFRSVKAHEVPKGLDLKRCEKEIVTIKNGKAYGGFEAARLAFWSLPIFWVSNWILYLPGAHFVGTRVYRWVAKNRMHLSQFACKIK